MKNIAIYCVTYNSYNALYNFLVSLDNLTKGDFSLMVFIADNSDKNTQQISYTPYNYELKTFTIGKNLGYFGAINYLMQRESPLNYDFSIISNVDLTLDKDIFVELSKKDEDVAWIAPQIYSNVEQRDRNPKIINRYPKKKLSILKILFHYPLLYNIYTRTLYNRKKFLRYNKRRIYAGHGSFIILTKKYFNTCGIIDYPIFLFCEEIYLGEQCYRNEMTVMYDPLLVVYDTEHVSTGQFKSKQYCKYNYEAIKYILKTFY